MPIMLIIWIAGMVCWQYFIINILFQKATFSAQHWRQLLELVLVLFLLTILISDCLCFAHIVKIRMKFLSVSFRDGSSSSYFSRKVLEFWAYGNSLHHLDCSLAVFYNNSFSGSKFFLPSMRVVLEFALKLFLLIIWIADLVRW